MKKTMALKDWCKAVPRRQAALAVRLGVSKSAVSQACTGEIKIPPDWYPTIVEFTGGVVSYEKLLETRLEKQEA